jgi:hypothetical protein
MSRAYRINVKESLERDLSASDEVCSDLEILQILPPEQMADLLRGELKGRGFEEENDKLVRVDKGVTVTVDPNTGEVSVKSETADKVELKAEPMIGATTTPAPARKRSAAACRNS